jgi:hypothetical protein
MRNTWRIGGTPVAVVVEVVPEPASGEPGAVVGVAREVPGAAGARVAMVPEEQAAVRRATALTRDDARIVADRRRGRTAVARIVSVRTTP